MINVGSEVGRLLRVMLHYPGAELEQITPELLERLLFDDIPFLRVAQTEHDRFAETLREQGTEVVYLEDLAAETLKANNGLRELFLADFLRESDPASRTYAAELMEFLMRIENDKELILKTMSGVRAEELNLSGRNSISGFLHDESRFLLDPVPNLYFTRDPFASIGRGAAIGSMYSVTRRRETIYGRYILKYHPDYAGKVRFWYGHNEPFSLEGGDVLNLSEKVLAVGISQRTMPEAIERLAANLFEAEDAEIETVLAFYIPGRRAFMHLDTVFTQLDYDKFVIHPGILKSLRVFELSPGRNGAARIREADKPLGRLLCKYLEIEDAKLILCGGSDEIAARREQWNDGSNTLCVAPGTVVAYDRNCVTNRIIEDNGVTVLRVPSSELSRGRGGPRCMSMPLWRE